MRMVHSEGENSIQQRDSYQKWEREQQRQLCGRVPVTSDFCCPISLLSYRFPYPLRQYCPFSTFLWLRMKNYGHLAWICMPPLQSLLQMMQKYIISIEDSQIYPFDTPSPFPHTVIRTTPSTTTSLHFQQIREKLHMIVAISCPFLVQVVRVHQRRGKSFTIDYEHVAEGLQQSQRIGQSGFLGELRDKLHQFAQLLAENGIQTDLKIQNMGIDKQGQPKIFIGLDFEILQQRQRKRLGEEYQAAVEKLLDANFGFRSSVKAHSDTQKSDYSHRLDQKLMEMEGKLSRLKLKSRNSSQESSGSSCQTLPADKSNTGLSKSSKLLNNTINTGTTQSAINNPVLKAKIHKSSFGDCETIIYRENQEMKRDESLKKRVTNALEKTQQAFKVYEKYSKRKRRI